MGVRGLQKFIENNSFWKTVCIDVAVEEWKRRNPNKKPIIIVDGGSLAFRDALCVSRGRYISGELNEFDKTLQNWLKKLINLDVQLVFFGSWGVEGQRIYEWIEKENNKVKESEKFYEWIAGGESATEIFEECRTIRTNLEYSLLVNFTPILSKYAEHKMTSVGRYEDQEIARYAKENDVMAILSNDTDFMIFDGYWKLWWNGGIDLDGFSVREYDRLMLNQELLLTFEQRPLYATLIGNISTTNRYYRELSAFHRRLPRSRCRDRFRDVAEYIRRTFRQKNLSLDHIDEIAYVVAQDIFGVNADDEKRQAIIDSIKSYDINYETTDTLEADPTVQLRLSNEQWNRAYTHCNIKVTQRSKWIYIHDDHTGQRSKRINAYFTEMIRKQVGLVNRDDCIEGTFKLIAKKSIGGSYRIYEEPLIFPNFPMPSLNDFYGNHEGNEELIALRWNVVAWLLSISDAQKNALISCNEDFRAPCATLLALVQLNILSIGAADSILIAEKMGRDDRIPRTPMVDRLNATHVQTALCYNLCYLNVVKAFRIAGLPHMLSEMSKFDVIFYQNLMAANQFDEASIESIAMYRIYIKYSHLSNS